jgi:hypothetical protein
VSYEEIGFAQQEAFFEMFPGPVIDSADIRRDPAGMLERLCAEIGLPFTDRMLSWPAGPKPYRWRMGRALVQRGASLHRVRRGRGSPAAGRAGTRRSSCPRPAGL